MLTYKCCDIVLCHYFAGMGTECLGKVSHVGLMIPACGCAHWTMPRFPCIQIPSTESFCQGCTGKVLYICQYLSYIVLKLFSDVRRGGRGRIGFSHTSAIINSYSYTHVYIFLKSREWISITAATIVLGQIE